jgi:hypothetical protein
MILFYKLLRRVRVLNSNYSLRLSSGRNPLNPAPHPSFSMLLRYTPLIAAILAVQSLATPSAVVKERYCTSANIILRKYNDHILHLLSYDLADTRRGTLSKAQRKPCTDAVLWLQSKPLLLDHTLAPAAKNHHDDFLAVHINQTIYIHLSGYFIAWHRTLADNISALGN